MAKRKSAPGTNQDSEFDLSAPFQPRPKRGELLDQGKALRKKCPRSQHGKWTPHRNRPGPLAHLEQSNQGRLAELIPLRHKRMLPTPFTFFRGSALNMAWDLGHTPSTGIRVQSCGDAHLGNFRCFATPERRLIFDIHDLDETLPAPWEWDLKRLAASIVLAGRVGKVSLTEKQCEEAVMACARSYREHMAEFSQMRAIEIWYSRFDADEMVKDIECIEARESKKGPIAKAKGLCVIRDEMPKLTVKQDGRRILKDQDLEVHHPLDKHGEVFQSVIAAAFAKYRESLPEERRLLLDRYQLQDFAMRVVGVGSVGTFCGLALLMASSRDPLFLQVKEARPSVLERFAGKSQYENQGQRVVKGHRLMQAASDLFLGWTRFGKSRDFYVRQLRDVKVKFEAEDFRLEELVRFATWCGGTLARAHARTGDPALISGYLGESEGFDEAIAQFARLYADQTEKDHEQMVQAAKEGKIPVAEDND